MHVLCRMVACLRRREVFCTSEDEIFIRIMRHTTAQSADKNTSYGMYKSACCGQKIVITYGATFPHCPRHRQSRTEWISINECVQAIRMVVFPHRVIMSHSDTYLD
jgi:hypothetical protein